MMGEVPTIDMIDIRQALPLLFMPLFISIALVILGLVLRRRWVSGLGITLLWLTSTPLLSSRLMRATELGAHRMPEEAAPDADAIVVLSTGRVVAPGPDRITEWTDADRFFSGVELYRARKAPLLVFTGARSAGAPSALSEGEVLSQYANELGVPAGSIRVSGSVTNTEDEAREVAAMLRSESRAHRVLLVTSAFHMVRARRLFEGAGFIVTPFPVDFRQPEGSRFDLTSLFPNAAAAGQTQLSLRELYGRLYYRLRGA
jgi:uncharacterized SAM-binding protein YcdF (DUF218 family)